MTDPVDTQGVTSTEGLLPAERAVVLEAWVAEFGLDWEQLAAYALHRARAAQPAGDLRPPAVRTADAPYTLGDWELGRAVRDAHDFAARFRATAERPDRVKLTVTRGNTLAHGGITELRLDDGYRLPIDFNGDGIVFFAPSDDPDQADVRLTDVQLYLHAPKKHNDSWLTEEGDDVDEADSQWYDD